APSKCSHSRPIAFASYDRGRTALAPRRSHFQRLEIRDTRLGEFPCLLNKIVLDPAAFRGGEGFHPINAALAERNLRMLSWLLQVDILQMHGVEPAWVPREVIGGDQAGRDRRHLELKLDQLRIEEVKK